MGIECSVSCSFKRRNLKSFYFYYSKMAFCLFNVNIESNNTRGDGDIKSILYTKIVR